MMDSGWTLLGALLLICSTSDAFVGLDAPKNVQVAADTVTDTSLLLTWDAVPKADSYTIVLKPPTISTTGVGSDITDAFSVIEGLDADTQYELTVFAVKGHIQGNPAVVAQRTALPAPKQAYVVVDSLSHDSMKIKWTAVEGAQSYTVNVQPSTGVRGDGRGIYQDSTLLKGLQPNTLYTINVLAMNWVGDGAAFTLKQTTKLGSPKNLRVLQATVTSTVIGLQWDDVVGAESYVIKVTPSARLPARILDTHIILRKLLPDILYQIEVSAVNIAGESTPSKINSRTLSKCFAKAQDFEDQQLSLDCPINCALHQDQVYGTREYTTDSYICASAIHDGRIDNNVGGVVTVRKKPGKELFEGSRQNGITSQSYYQFHQSFVFELQPPQKLSVVPGSVTYNGFTIKWLPVRGAPVYRISLVPSESNELIIQEETKVAFSDLLANTTYSVFVVAISGDETSEAATLQQGTTLPSPKAVEVVEQSVTNQSFMIQWQAVSGTKYYIISADSSTTTKAFYGNTSDTSVVATDLMSGTPYNITVQAVNHVGAGKPFHLNQYTVLTQPANIATTLLSSDEIKIVWNPVPGATMYNITVLPCCKLSRLTEDNFFLLDGLQPDTEYQLEISAVNEVSKTKPFVFKQRTALGSIERLHVVEGSLTNDSVKLSWTPLPNAQKYTVIISGPHGLQKDLISYNTTKISLTGLLPQTNYSATVSASNDASYGKNTTVTFFTLLPPPNDLKLQFQLPDQVQVYWNQVPNVISYYVSCEPSFNIVGIGHYTRSPIHLSGMQSFSSYKVSVMGVASDVSGMNATQTITTALAATPMLTLIHVTPNSASIVWKSESVTVERFSISKMGTEVKKDYVNENHVFIRNLIPATYYQLISYVNISNSVSGSLSVGFHTSSDVPNSMSNDFNVTLAWLPVHQSDEYKVEMLPLAWGDDNSNYIDSNAEFHGLEKDKLYTVNIISINKQHNASSQPAPFYLSWNDFQTTDDNVGILPPGEEDTNWIMYTTTASPDNVGKVPSGKDESSKIWIAIVVIVGCLLLLFLLMFIPCMCDVKRSKPLVRNRGCCTCSSW